MNLRPTLTAFAVAVMLASASRVHAQSFRSRFSGGSLSAQTGPAFTEFGCLRGNERYLRGGAPVASRSSTFTKISVRGNEEYIRGNRRKTDFVGTDLRESHDFVGSPSGDSGGRTQSGVTKRRTESNPDANRQPRAPRPRTVMYSPQLSVDFDFRPLPLEQVSTDLGAQLETSLTRHAESAVSIGPIRSIEVSLEGQTATLRGEVSSERERTLAELLALFEPGISNVQNELAVRPLSAPGADRAPRSSRDDPATAAKAQP